MTFPESDRIVYGVHTLAQVICQLQFPPILSVGTEVPSAFQERLREAYPLYERTETSATPPELAHLFAQLPIKPAHFVTHRFSTADGHRSITLAPDFLAIAETDYDEWPALRPAIATAKLAFEDLYRPAFYTRVGLRYQDVIDRDTLNLARPWSDLINPGLAGLLGAPEPTVRESVQDTSALALITLDGAEQAAVRLSYGLARAADNPAVIFLIDADYFSDRQRGEGEVLELLDYFNAEAGRLFRWAITDVLRDALGCRDVAERAD